MAIDSQWSNVSLLLPFSESLLDAKGNTVTPVGGAALSSAVGNPFGAGNACHFDGAGDYLTIPAISDLNFGTGDFTIEMWVYVAAPSSPDGSGNRGAMLLGSYYNGASFSSGLSLSLLGSTTVTGTSFKLQYSNGSAWTTIVDSGVSVTNGGWHHIAVSRSGTSARAFLDGSLCATNTNSTNISAGYLVNFCGLGADPSYPQYLNGYIFDIRTTKSNARYTAAFYAPSSPFPRPTIKGIVLDASSAPVEKRVVALKRSTMLVAGTTLSDAGTGLYTIYPADFSEHIVYRVDASTYPLVDGGSGENALIYDRVIPGG